MKNIGIVGCGWLGYRLANYFRNDYNIFSTTRTQSKFNDLQMKGFHPTLIDFNEIENVSKWKVSHQLDVVLVAVPLSLKRDSREELDKKINGIINFIKDFKGQLFVISSTGIYPQYPKIYKEKDVKVSQISTESEFEKEFPKVNILRLGGLMGDDRLLKKYMPKDLDNVVNHIHYKDICRAFQLMIESDVKGEVYNIVAPSHPTKSQVLAAQMGEKNTEPLVCKPQRIISSEKIIQDLDFEFKYPNPMKFHLK